MKKLIVLMTVLVALAGFTLMTFTFWEPTTTRLTIPGPTTTPAALLG